MESGSFEAARVAARQSRSQVTMSLTGRCMGPHRVAFSGWSVRLHAFTFASSHFHLLVWARSAALASFQQPAPELHPPHHRVARPRGRSGRSGSSGSGTPGWRPPPATGPLSFLSSNIHLTLGVLYQDQLSEPSRAAIHLHAAREGLPGNTEVLERMATLFQ
ncbi:MAG TPA: hypothetical protein VEU50_13110, partial [Archangium sp.]|nr:hypothetical protein [Archangium sp.]